MIAILKPVELAVALLTVKSLLEPGVLTVGYGVGDPERVGVESQGLQVVGVVADPRVLLGLPAGAAAFVVRINFGCSYTGHSTVVTTKS